MKVTWRTGGGIAAIPGLSAPRTVETDALPPGLGAALERLVREARFFTLPASLPAPAGSADYQSYDIEIEDGPRRHRIVAADPIADERLRALVNQLRQL